MPEMRKPGGIVTGWTVGQISAGWLIKAGGDMITDIYAAPNPKNWSYQLCTGRNTRKRDWSNAVGRLTQTYLRLYPELGNLSIVIPLHHSEAPRSPRNRQ